MLYLLFEISIVNYTKRKKRGNNKLEEIAVRFFVSYFPCVFFGSYKLFIAAYCPLIKHTMLILKMLANRVCTAKYCVPAAIVDKAYYIFHFIALD